MGRHRYAEIKGRKRKGAFLDEFCAVTGLGRKHAMATLNGRNRRGTRRRGHPRKFSAEAARLLAKAWRLAGMPRVEQGRRHIDAAQSGLRRILSAPSP